jgi:hypothetical protein
MASLTKNKALIKIHEGVMAALGCRPRRSDSIVHVIFNAGLARKAYKNLNALSF